MTADEKASAIVRFMELKRDAMDFPEYFTEEDADEILEWPPQDVKFVFSVLEKYIVHNPHELNDAKMCPFCIIYSHCYECGYRERHGRCDKLIPNNSYFLLLRHLNVKDITKFLSCTEIKALWEKAKEEGNVR